MPKALTLEKKRPPAGTETASRYLEILVKRAKKGYLARFQGMRLRIHAFIKPAALVLLAGHLAFGADAPRNLPAREPVRMAEPPSKRPAPMPENGNEKSTKKDSAE